MLFLKKWFPSLKIVPYLSGLNPSSSSRKTLLLVTVLSWLGMMRNLRMVPLLDPRNRTVLFLCGPASVSTTILFSWYLHRRRPPHQSHRAVPLSWDWSLKAKSKLRLQATKWFKWIKTDWFRCTKHTLVYSDHNMPFSPESLQNEMNSREKELLTKKICIISELCLTFSH